ncbi:hypothetical protein ACAW74_07920 [Fibrella sp. WM1]|uniref:hypothetical protein n=1 Tax=Fibrella musci TaxID=3242485 RepID=UPI003520D88A
MKSIQFSVLLLISIIFSCKNDDQILGNRVAGTWSLERIRYANPNRPGMDTTITLQGATMRFDACQYKRGESLNCTGQHQVFNNSAVPFNFDIDGVKQSSLSLNQQYNQYTPKRGDLDLNGNYFISFSDNNNQMEMKGRYYLYGSDKVLDETAYFTLKRN